MEKWVREELERRRCSADKADVYSQHGGAAGRATAGRGRREKEDEGGNRRRQQRGGGEDGRKDEHGSKDGGGQTRKTNGASVGF